MPTYCVNIRTTVTFAEFLDRLTASLTKAGIEQSGHDRLSRQIRNKPLPPLKSSGCNLLADSEIFDEVIG